MVGVLVGVLVGPPGVMVGVAGLPQKLESESHTGLELSEDASRRARNEIVEAPRSKRMGMILSDLILPYIALMAIQGNRYKA